tara:strand:+ start:310 stop:678 length:369 start_codon:yes stop_codon:yes gene_type:complete
MYSRNIYNKPLKKALNLINNNHKIEIIYNLSLNKMRFGEIKKNLNYIRQQMLTKQLRELERDNLIKRKKFDGFPRKVEYSLTPLGASLKPILNSIIKWEDKKSKELNKLMKKKKLETIFDYY